ncbi:hypothetical protein Tco_1497400, partial [Tanacetum coccineum]
MMTYLKHTDKYRHNQLNKKTFEEIQALYIKEQERDADFVPIGSERDEKMIDKMNKKAAGMDEEEVPESAKVEVKKEGHEENIKKRSEEEQLRAYLKIVPDEEEEIDYEVLGMRYPIVNWESAFYHTDRYGVPHDYYRVFRANGKIFNNTPERIDLVLWGDLRIMFKETVDDDIWKNQEKWIIKSWTFYENCGVHILALEDGTEIHMLAERRYPLIRETLERMMELRLTTESEGEAMSLKNKMGVRRIFECWFSDHTTNGHQFTMSNRHQELASPEANDFCKELASPKQTALGKDISNPLIVGSLLKTIWLSVYHVIVIKHWLFQSKRLL